MPTISRPGVNPATNVNPATGVNPATNTGAAQQPGSVQGAVQSGAGQVVNAQRVTIGGLGTATMNATGTTNRFARDASFDTYNSVGDGAVSRGYIKLDAQPIAGGCRVHVQSFHGGHNDSVTLYLLAEVMDTKTNQLRTITLSVLANGANLNGNTYRGNTYYDISYADVNAYLQSKNPALSITPGQTQLGVAARWGNGHQAGGFARGGAFRIPPEAKAAQSAQLVRAAATSRTGTDQADMPLDMQVAYPPQLVQQVPQLKPDGSVVSRLESELKGGTTKPAMVHAVKEMYRLAELAQKGDKKEVEALLGKDWTVETVNRYWLADDGTNTEGHAGKGFMKGFRVDDNGLPLQDPMVDVYMDDANLSMTRHEGAIRLRKNKQATVVNVKPGGGRRDEKTQITQRVEVGVELKPDANTADASVAMRTLATNAQWSGTVFNHAQREMSKLDPTLQLANTLVPWLDIVQDRHKFTLKNEKTGVEIELSLDFVKTTTLRPNHANADGTARVEEFCVLEAELDHLQLQSANRGTFAAAAGSNVNNAAFTSESQQDTWLKQTSQNVTMDIEPRLHELKDLENQSFRSTSSYKQFETVSERMLPLLFPKGLESGRQKAAYAAELMGLVCFDDRQLLASTKKTIQDGGFVWSPAIEQAYLAAIKVPATRVKMDQMIAAGTAKNVPQFLQLTLGANVAALEYDVAKAKKRVEGRLAECGYQSTPEIDAMLDKLTPQLVQPAYFEQYLVQMQNYQDAQVMSQFAAALRVSPVPVPKADVKKLLTSQKALIEQHLEAAAVDKAGAAAVIDFIERASTAGATLYELRQLVAQLASNPQQRLTAIAQQKNVPGGAPTLRASLANVMKTVDASLQRQYLKSDDAMRDFVKATIANRTPQEALTFAQSLANGAAAVLAQEAKRVGTAAPALAWDHAAVEAFLAPTFTNLRVTFDAPIKKLVADCLAAGVPPAILQRGFNNLQTMPMAQALQQGGVYLVGVKIPEASYDAAATEAYVRQGLASFVNALPTTSNAVGDWTTKMLKAGFTPQQIYTFATYTPSYGRQQAAAYIQNPPLSSIPAFPWDIDALVASWKPNLGAAVTPAVETFLKTSLEKSLDVPTFALNNVTRYATNLRYMCQQLSTASGIAMPAGV